MKSLIILTLSTLLALGAVNAYGLSKNEIKIAARQSSVQPSFFIPVIKVYFATTLEEEEKEQTIEEVKKEMAELMEKRIKDAIEKATEDANEPRYLTTLTDIEKYGVLGKSRQEIALGTIAPEYAKFPEKVLVVSKIDKKNISAYGEEFEKDVLAISETTGVSASKAKNMLKKLATEGYQVTKDTVKPETEVVLLHFNGWDDSYPSTLKWEVRVNGGNNLIRGYDPRGILIIQTLPEDQDGEIQRVYVKAGYFDLKEQFKLVPHAEEALAEEKKALEEKIKELEKQLEKPEVIEKRDITNATMYDVLYGYVILERYYVRTGASGVYLGNMKARKEMTGYSWGNYHILDNERRGIVLTNSHVVAFMYGIGLHVAKDKQTMWIILPAHSYIRYTQDSDTFGSPAHLLVIDGVPVDSYDNDCAILMTSPIPGYEKYAAKLGDSDLVEQGLEVVVVGSPMMIQKQLTQGVISNTKYSTLKSPIADGWLAKGMSRRAYEWAQASSFWVDVTIGAGGSSGSPVIALEGSQMGKVVALRNMGIVSRHVIAKPLAKQAIDPIYLVEKIGNGPIRLILPANKDIVFQDFDHKRAIYSIDAKDITGKDETIETILANESKQDGSKQDIAGLNGAIPINEIKSFLAERGLDLKKFGTQRMSSRYWTK